MTTKSRARKKTACRGFKPFKMFKSFKPFKISGIDLHDLNIRSNAHKGHKAYKEDYYAGKNGTMRRSMRLLITLLLFMTTYGNLSWAQQKPLEKVRLTVPAKSLTFIPFYFGKAQGMFAREGIDLEIIVMRPPLGVTALVAGDLDYSAAGGLSIRAAMKGAAIRVIGFIQTRLSFSLVGQHYG